MRPLLRLLLILAVVLPSGMGFFGCDEARAQAGPVLVTAVSLVQVNDSETRLTLRVNRLLPPFSLVTNDSEHIEFSLAGAQRGPGATLTKSTTSLIRGIEFKQTGQILSLEITGNAPLHATAVADTTEQVTVSFIRANVPSNDDSTGKAELPQTSQPPPGESYELVPLKYADVSEVVGLLTNGLTVKPNDNFKPREPAFGSNSLTGNSYNQTFTQPVSQTPQLPLGQSVDSAIAIDRRLNAIWLRGTPEQIARLKAEIKKIDVPVDSVILETELVELTQTGAKAVGIDFANANGQLSVGTFQTGQFIPYGDLPNGGGHLNKNGLEAGGHLTSASLQAAIYAQVEKGQGKIVSKPRIAAQSGSTAKIVTGDALPILTSITLSGVNGVSQQVQYVNVGVTLQIAPRVSSDGFVTSHIFCVVSSVSGYSQGYPTISQREAETSATVHDGDSFVIGGLTQNSTITSRTKIPVLGDIPLIGQAFRTDRSTRSKTELYIVVTPHIVHRRKNEAVAAAAPPVSPPTILTAASPAP